MIEILAKQYNFYFLPNKPYVKVGRQTRMERIKGSYNRNQGGKMVVDVII